jgi:hypothetical protein
METDIRMMLEGLRPVSEFYASVERTIEVLDKAIVDNMPFGAMNEAHVAEFDDLVELREFWRGILARKDSEPTKGNPDTHKDTITWTSKVIPYERNQ